MPFSCISFIHTRIKDKHRGVTHEFQVNPKNYILRNACKMHMQILALNLGVLFVTFCTLFARTLNFVFQNLTGKYIYTG
jgi:hypothetical protein